MSDSIGVIKQITLQEAEEYFGKPYNFIECKDNKKEVYDYKGKLVGYLTVTYSDNLKDFK